MSSSSRQSSRRANRLLSALQPDDFAHLEPHLEWVELKKDTVLYETNEGMPFVYFPHEAVVSLMTALPDGRTVETAVLGWEAMVGSASTLVTRQSLGRYVVQTPGSASRIDAGVLHRAFEERLSLRDPLLRYEAALLAEALQTMACTIAHDVEARCCRWLLTMRDRADQASLPFTHEHLSRMLGVQRSTVSLVTCGLQSTGLIRQRRGAITVTDGSGLEQIACGCYAVARQRSWQL
ncbi:Crp/Fnr family transcriptional regulator [Microvirga sp. VF16]|uniref:Crp/Fnr family transcriptional regulator n=1 Tax=Microvirga sp. VF16 TaxID=2807101 RepID=UPI00193D1181|nr:Crp/Fnr family transcriptional regulator [Microvirga sp. VF16]QRM32255.1 Crp/Fnr family transcriptional regulator [Microvirga sp. VF16]